MSSKKDDLLRRFDKTRDDLEAFARDEAVWKRRFTDAVLELFREGAPVTPETLRTRLTAMEGRPITITGTEMRIEFSREASRAAIAHLDEITGPPKSDMG